MQMPKYRKKPVVIEAIQFRAGEQDCDLAADVVTGKIRYPEDGTMLIQTLEGVMCAQPGDWIIRGVKGELYPCKPDIFAATYERVEVPTIASLEALLNSEDADELINEWADEAEAAAVTNGNGGAAT
jgi:hypothetical protein